MNSTDFVDDISITFLYVSSSDLVLKIINTENYHFCTIQNITNKDAECQIFIHATNMREHEDDTYKKLGRFEQSIKGALPLFQLVVIV